MQLCPLKQHFANRNLKAGNGGGLKVPHRELVHVSLQHPLQVQLLEFPLQSGGQARVHGGPPRQHDVFVELGPERRQRDAGQWEWDVGLNLMIEMLSHPLGTWSERALFLSHLVSMSAAWMVLKSSSATPTPSTLMRWGWKSASGASKRSPPTLITRPSGSWTHGNERPDESQWDGWSGTLWTKKIRRSARRKQSTTIAAKTAAQEMMSGAVRGPFRPQLHCPPCFACSPAHTNPNTGGHSGLRDTTCARQGVQKGRLQL